MNDEELRESFEKVLDEVGSGFHDSRLIWMRMAMLPRELAVVLHYSDDTPEKPVGDVYHAFFVFDDVTELRLESKGGTFPTEVLIDHFQAVPIAGDDSGCEFTLVGMYAWNLIWRASAFRFRKSPAGERPVPTIRFDDILRVESD
jgi:hypothetical protein